MSIISTKKLLISLILVMGIMVLGIVNKVEGTEYNYKKTIGDEFEITAPNEYVITSIQIMDEYVPIQSWSGKGSKTKNDDKGTYIDITKTGGEYKNSSDIYTNKIKVKIKATPPNKQKFAIYVTFAKWYVGYIATADTKGDQYFISVSNSSTLKYTTINDSWGKKLAGKPITATVTSNYYKDGKIVTEGVYTGYDGKGNFSGKLNEDKYVINNIQKSGNNYNFDLTIKSSGAGGTYYMKFVSANGTIIPYKFVYHSIFTKPAAPINTDINFTVDPAYKEAVKSIILYKNCNEKGDCTTEWDKSKIKINVAENVNANNKIECKLNVPDAGKYYMRFTNVNDSSRVIIYKFEFTAVDGSDTGGDITPPAKTPLEELQEENLASGIDTSNMTEITNKKGNAKNDYTRIYNEGGEIIASINPEATVEIIGETEDYYKIVWKETGVFAHIKWLNGNKTKEYGEFYGPNIRTQSGSGDNILGDIVAGYTFESVENGTGSYKKVSFEIEGFVEKEKLTTTEGKETGGSLVEKLLGLVQITFNLGEKLFNMLAGGEEAGNLLGALAQEVLGVVNLGTSGETGILGKGMEILKDMGNGFRILGENIKENIEGTDGLPGFGPIIETLVEIPVTKLLNGFQKNMRN